MSIDPDSLIEIPEDEVQSLLEENEEVELTPEEESMFINILQIGIKQKEIEFFGHTAIISTLTTEEEIELGVPVAKYQDIPTQSHAFRAAVVAASLREVDGKPLYIPLAAKQEKVVDQINQKFRVVIKYSPTIVSYLYQKQLELTEEMKTLWAKLGKE